MEISGFFLSRKLEACKIKEKGGDRPVNDLSKIGYTIKSIRKSKGMTLKPVSYTHLDVYKRQGPGSVILIGGVVFLKIPRPRLKIPCPQLKKP